MTKTSYPAGPRYQGPAVNVLERESMPNTYSVRTEAADGLATLGRRMN